MRSQAQTLEENFSLIRSDYNSLLSPKWLPDRDNPKIWQM